MKTLLIVLLILAAVVSTAYAKCGYVWVDNKSYWVCTYGG